jgi:hypothetical protein
MFVRDLLQHPENLIKIGRDGDDIADFTVDYIAVDSIGAAIRQGSGEKYDGVTEVMTYAQQWQAPVTLSFYGDNAWDNATKFGLLIQSQASYELQQSLGIGVFQASQITDVKILTGQQYGNRYEIAINVQYSISANVDTLRIDTALIELSTETGVEIEP